MDDVLYGKHKEEFINELNSLFKDYKNSYKYNSWSTRGYLKNKIGAIPFEQAFYFVSQAAKQGYAIAEFMLYNKFCGQPRIVDSLACPITELGNFITEEAKEYLKKAALQGHIYAQCLLGERFKNSESEKWVTQAATQGNLYALRCLAKMYSKEKGITRNLHKAFEIFTQLTKQAVPRGRVNRWYDDASLFLAEAYLEGKIIKQDFAKSIFWFKECCRTSCPAPMIGRIGFSSFLKLCLMLL